MAASASSTFWQRCRKIFRQVRLVLWIVLFAAIFTLLYLNQVGLPGFIKRPILKKLRARGVEITFKKLRLSWYRGFIADDVEFGHAEDPTTPHLSAGQVQLILKGSELQRLDFQIGGLSIRNARLAWPLVGTNQLAFEKVNADLRFLPGDLWQLDNLEAQLTAAKFRVTGSLTNASAFHDWRIFQARENDVHAPPQQKLERLQKIADTLARIKFASPPTVRLDFSLDASNKQPFRGAIRARLDQGSLVIKATLAPPSRELTFVVNSDFDLQKIRPLLPEKADIWLGRFSWDNPPEIRMLGLVVLPPWTNSSSNWGETVASKLRLEGELKVGPAAFRNIPVLTAQTRVLYDNLTWHLQDMHIQRPEGELVVDHWTDMRTRDYYWHLRGTIDPKAVHPLLEPPQQHALDLVGFTTPPELDVQIWSRWYERERTGVKGQVTVSNFTFRGETARSLNTAVEYTNLWLRLIEPRVARGENGEQHGELPGVAVDFGKRMLYLTNGFSTLDPMVVARAVGEKTTRALAPYEFLTPPTAHIDGSVSISTSRIADLRIQIEGGPFHWWKFNLPHIAGNVVWSNQSLLLTNVAAQFYGGELEGWAGFDFSPSEGNTFQFDLHATNANLAQFLPDLGGKANRLTGNASGRLVVTRADTKDIHSWQGYGDLMLRDGQLWEIPVFGLFSPLLNTVYPNLGSGRASDGSATYTISNSVITTDNLQLHSPAMRMQYRGSVDFNGNLNARAEAEMLRNTAVIGPIVSTVLWPVTKLFEYKISGTLSQPLAEPVYIPKLFLFPLHPFQTLKGIFSESPATNTSPRFMEPSTEQLEGR